MRETAIWTLGQLHGTWCNSLSRNTSPCIFSPMHYHKGTGMFPENGGCMLSAKNSSQGIRRAKFAGSWYPKNPKVLEDLLDQAFSLVKGNPPSSTCAVLPHAGLSFSALGMADFFYDLPPQTEKLVLLEP
ncbi:MAG: AmmeMemoRadiSam system protein B, partial [Spirochaetia bacterium]|nr:AmmeMemoRadiSam system protein B [Spirochaetia bacterium]